MPAHAPAGLYRASARLALFAPLLLAAPARALTVNPVFDSSITGLPQSATIQSAFRAAAAAFESRLNDPVTVNVGVAWGRVNGTPLPGGALGSSVTNLYGYYTYGQVKSWLAADAASPADRTAVAALPAAPASGNRYVVPTAEAKALGLVPGASAAMDGYIGFAGTPANYGFSTTDALAPGTYAFVAVAAHEISEVLGRMSGLNGASPSWATPYDLFRYSAKGVTGFSYTDPAYFSIDGGATGLAAFNASGAGGDRGDWASGGTRDIADAFTAPGTHPILSNADLVALDVIGWNGGSATPATGLNNAGTVMTLVDPDPDVPEPAGLAVLGAGLLGLGLMRGRVGPGPARKALGTGKAFRTASSRRR